MEETHMVKINGILMALSELAMSVPRQECRMFAR